MTDQNQHQQQQPHDDHVHIPFSRTYDEKANELLENILQFERKDEDDFYAILGCSPFNSQEQIQTEYKRKALLMHPDKVTNTSSKEQAQKQFSQLNRAYQVLSNPELRKTYDSWKQSGVQISWNQWLEMNEDLRSSFHWSGAKQKPTLPSNDPNQAEKDEERKQQFDDNGRPRIILQNNNSAWKKDKNEDSAIKAFREYQV